MEGIMKYLGWIVALIIVILLFVAKGPMKLIVTILTAILAAAALGFKTINASGFASKLTGKSNQSVNGNSRFGSLFA